VAPIESLNEVQVTVLSSSKGLSLMSSTRFTNLYITIIIIEGASPIEDKGQDVLEEVEKGWGPEDDK
jgi:hypothetical protein